MWSCECVSGATVSQQSRNMSPRNVCRSFIISLVVVLLFLELPINGFSIRSASERKVPEISVDLTAEESTLLEVKNTKKRPNDIKNFEVKTDETVHKFDATEHPKDKVEVSTFVDNRKLMNTNLNVDKRDMSEGLNNSVTTFITAGSLKPDEYESTIIFITVPTSKITETDTPQITIENQESKDITTKMIKQSTHFRNDLSYRKTLIHTPKDEVTKTSSYNTEPITVTNTDFQTGTTEMFLQTSFINLKGTKRIIKNETSKKNTESPELQVTSTPLKLHTDKTVLSVDNNSDATYPISVITDPSTVEKPEPTELDYSRSSETQQKKYTVIYRKRPNTTENNTANTDVDTDMTRAETSQTNYIFDKPFSLTSLTSLEQIKADKINGRNQLLHNQITLNPLQRATGNEFTVTASMSPSIIPQTKIGTVSSMRAGFLDYSGKLSTRETTIYESNNDTFGDMYESIDLGGNYTVDHKNISLAGTQSQLSEDEIKEELLKEEMMSDQIENEKISRDDRDDNKDIKIIDLDAHNTVDKQSSLLSKTNVSEDGLGVQPISQEQVKNADLYVVSPNYKPMKRIEVQPAKPFVRDPDDNSWRNVSISSLGIVFKPKNSSKSFTQVLKNKTETELSSFTDRDNKTGLPDLRKRLEKIAEVRKSKKKRVNKNGDAVYSDYEENNSSGESITIIKVDDMSSDNSTETTTITITSTPATLSSVIPETTQSSSTEEETNKVTKENIFKFEGIHTLTTQPPQKKLYNIAEYYDTTDEYDADYLTLSKIDIKKFTIPVMTTETTVPSPTPGLAKPLRLPDRKPTVEYFPPRVSPKIYDYDNNFQKKINLYELKDNTKSISGGFYASPTIATYEDREEFDKAVKPVAFPLNRHEHINLNKNLYITEIPQAMSPHSAFDVNDDNLNRAPYVIKHYRDFINAAAKGDDDKNTEYIAPTESPVRGTALDELVRIRMNRVKPAIDQDYEYQMPYRKDIVNRFVNIFKQDTEKYKVDFPIVFNNSIDHRKYHTNGNVPTSSNAFIKRLYGNTGTATKPTFPFVKPCDPNCDKITVELSPAYELHYYVPEQEEKQVADIRPRTVSYRYRL